MRIQSLVLMHLLSRTPVECGGLCLSNKDCYAFFFVEANITCFLFQEEGMCFTNREKDTVVEVYAEEAKYLPRCPGKINCRHLLFRECCIKLKPPVNPNIFPFEIVFRSKMHWR